MPSASGRPYLSEAINYDTDIEPYQFIKIYAGVGSGKNVFVDNLVKGNVFRHSDGSIVEKKYVLLFTSRRAKANEQLKQKIPVMIRPSVYMIVGIIILMMSKYVSMRHQKPSFCQT